jgi:hypothetical protein
VTTVACGVFVAIAAVGAAVLASAVGAAGIAWGPTAHSEMARIVGHSAPAHGVQKFGLGSTRL